jgi:hypothetical protein
MKNSTSFCSAFPIGIGHPNRSHKSFFEICALAISLLSFISLNSVAQVFINSTGTIPDVTYSVSAWADYDNDGYQDLIISGNNFFSPVPITRIYHNDYATGGTFSNFINPESIVGLHEADIDWGDFNSDGNIDFIICGLSLSSGEKVTQIWQNIVQNGAHTFKNVTNFVVHPNFTLPGVSLGTVNWIDIEADGDLDFILTGEDVDPYFEIWRNDHDPLTQTSTFIQISAMTSPHNGVMEGDVAVADYDQDGDQDFALIGYERSTGTSVLQVWRNNGSGSFSNAAASFIGALGAASGSVTWGDYDNDGFVDLLVTGVKGVGSNRSPHIQILKNFGGGYLQDVTASDPDLANLPKVYDSDAAFIDYDADGDLDLLIQGDIKFYPNNTAITRLFQNGGTGTTGKFVDITIAPNIFPPNNILEQVSLGDFSVADFNMDGKQDFLVTGWSHGTVLWKNNSAVTCPAPYDLTLTKLDAHHATFTWKGKPGEWFDFMYRKIGSGWSSSFATNSFTLDNLEAGATYEAKVRTTCSASSSNYTGVINFKTPNYCTSSGTSSADDYIDFVALNTLSRTSGNDLGYSNMKSMSTILQKNGSYTVYFSAGNVNHNRTFRVWIDYNRDGDFGDAGELLVTTTSNSLNTLNASFVVPSNAETGNTVIRVSTRNSTSAPAPCATGFDGEVEDYAVYISSSSASSTARTATTSESITVEPETEEITIYPNPAKHALKLQGTYTGREQITIRNFTGNVVYQGEVFETLDISGWKPGVYLLIVDGEKRNTFRFMIDK